MQEQNKQLQAKNDVTLQSKVIARNTIKKCADKLLGDEWAMHSTLQNSEVLTKESLLEK